MPASPAPQRRRCGKSLPHTLTTIALVVVLASLLGACSPEPGFQRDPASLWPFSFVWTPGSSHPHHAHIVAASHVGQWEAEPGYELAETGSLMARWKPGLRHPGQDHIASATTEGQWVADPGYRFTAAQTLAVEWAEGLGHPQFAHIRSAAQEGYWDTEPGYRFVDPEHSLVAAWAPGHWHPTAAQVLSGRQEGQWIAGPGYRFTATSALVAPAHQADLSVEWVAGSQHPVCQTLVAADQPGSWKPASGYRFASSEPGRFEVIRDATSSRMGEALASATVAVVAGAMSEPAPDDGLIVSLGKGILRHIGKGFGRAAVDTVVDEVTRPSGGTGAGEVIGCDYWALER